MNQPKYSISKRELIAAFCEWIQEVRENPEEFGDLDDIDENAYQSATQLLCYIGFDTRED